MSSFYKTNDVSQPHEPHHTSSTTITTVNINSFNTAHQIRLRGPLPHPCHVHAHVEDAGSGPQLPPDHCQPPLLHGRVPSYVSGLVVRCLVSTVHPLLSATSDLHALRSSSSGLVPIREVPRSARDIPHPMLSSRTKVIKPCHQRR